MNIEHQDDECIVHHNHDDEQQKCSSRDFTKYPEGQNISCHEELSIDESSMSMIGQGECTSHSEGSMNNSLSLQEDGISTSATTQILSIQHENRLPPPSSSSSNKKQSESKRFVTKMATISTISSVVILCILAALFSEWTVKDVIANTSVGDYTNSNANAASASRERVLVHSQNQWDNSDFTEMTTHYSMHNNFRQLEQEEEGGDNNNNNNNQYNAAAADEDGDYSSYRCDDIFVNTPTPSQEKDDTTNPTKRCQYAQTCNGGDGLLLPFVFCHTSTLSTLSWMLLLSPILLLILSLLFRLLGSTAEEYFSPSLEMFSFQLGLPPRFAGVTLLALGNGAADVSATMNAISSDPENGYKMSLGALTGAAMFITTVVAGSVILANGGVVCRGALVRDVMVLGATVVVVALNLEKGEVSAGVSMVYLLYIFL